MSLRDDILAFADPFLDLRAEPVPEWGGLTVYYRGWSGIERDKFEVEFGDLEKTGRQNLRARILVRCLLDETGARIFKDEDAAALGGKNSVVIDRLFQLVSELNGLTASSREAAKKNSSTTPSESSSGSLPTNSDTPA